MRLFGDATGSGAEQSTSHAQPHSTSIQDAIKEAVQARSAVMFSGKTGKVVKSGIKEDAATAE